MAMNTATCAIWFNSDQFPRAKRPEPLAIGDNMHVSPDFSKRAQVQEMTFRKYPSHWTMVSDLRPGQ
jgi:hypothetical protein